MTDAERDLLATTAHLLAQGDRLDALSRGFTTVAAAGLVLVPALAGAFTPLLAGALLAVLLAGLCETYLAIRVGFDAALFASIAEATAPPDLAGLDSALMDLGIMPVVKVGRPLPARIVGARRLMARQMIMVALQAFLLVICILG